MRKRKFRTSCVTYLILNTFAVYLRKQRVVSDHLSRITTIVI